MRDFIINPKDIIRVEICKELTEINESCKLVYKPGDTIVSNSYLFGLFKTTSVVKEFIYDYFNPVISKFIKNVTISELMDHYGGEKSFKELYVINEDGIIYRKPSVYLIIRGNSWDRRIEKSFNSDQELEDWINDKLGDLKNNWIRI